MENEEKNGKAIYLHEVQDYLLAYTQIREILGRLDVPAERISTRLHLEHDLDLGKAKRSALISLLEQQYGISIDKGQMQYVSDAIELILVEG